MVTGDQSIYRMELQSYQALIAKMRALIVKAPTGELEKYKALKISQRGDGIHSVSNVLEAIT